MAYGQAFDLCRAPGMCHAFVAKVLGPNACRTQVGDFVWMCTAIFQGRCVLENYERAFLSLFNIGVQGRNAHTTANLTMKTPPLCVHLCSPFLRQTDGHTNKAMHMVLSTNCDVSLHAVAPRRTMAMMHGKQPNQCQWQCLAQTCT